MGPNESEANPQLLAGKIVNKYFPEATACMIIGSLAGKAESADARDLDLIIVAPFAFNSGVQNLTTELGKVDVTILPQHNFEYILLNEVFSGKHMSSFVYGLQQGEIVFDTDGRLAYYQAIAKSYQDEKHTIFSFRPEVFMEYVFAANKYLSDYAHKTDVLESFLLKEKLINSILDLESLFTVGWLFQGKIKGRYLKARNPAMAAALEGILAMGDGVETHKALVDWATGYLAHFAKLIEAYVPKYRRQIFQGDTCLLQFADAVAYKQVVHRLFQLLNTDTELSPINIYALSRPFRILNSHHYLIAIKGNPQLLQKKLLPLFEEVRDKFQFCQPSYQRLLEVFFGGTRSMEACQQCWSLLSRERFTEQGSLYEVDTNTALLHIFFFTGMAANYTQDTMVDFLEYLLESWLPYAYTDKAHVYLEKTAAMQQIQSIFAEKLAAQEASIEKYTQYLIGEWPHFEAEQPWQKTLYTTVAQLYQQLDGIDQPIHIPACEAKILKAFNHAHESTWYVQKRQLEMVFSLFDENERNWAFLVAFAIAMLKQGRHKDQR